MIGRGKQGDVYLYEITEQDLLLGQRNSEPYKVGNVLLFADKKSIALGAEFARADDLASAREYISQQATSLPDKVGSNVIAKDYSNDSNVAELLQRLEQQDDSLRGLTEKIEQRDELLKEITESLQSQQLENELLQVQIDYASEQMAVGEMVRSELIDDLQNVSKDTHTIESTLQNVLEEKYSLEQELAQRITELVELNLQNDDLKRQLGSKIHTQGGTKAQTSNVAIEPSVKHDQSVAESSMAQGSGVEQDHQILTMSTGKRIHVLHEFPEAKKPSVSSRIQGLVLSASRTIGVIILVVIGLIIVSVLATAQVNGISYGEALDLIVSSLSFK